MSARADGWRSVIFRYRGALLVPVALALIVFGKPTLYGAVIGIACALIGEGIRVWAVGYSGETTRGDEVTAPMLVTAGPYSQVRNPLYLGNAIVALGFWMALTGAVTPLVRLLLLLVTLVCVVGVYAAIIPHEEAYLENTFGEKFRAYRAAVPRIFPFSRPLRPELQTGTWRPEVILRAESITLGFFVLMLCVVILKLSLPL